MDQILSNNYCKKKMRNIHKFQGRGQDICNAEANAIGRGRAQEGAEPPSCKGGFHESLPRKF